LFEIFLTYCTVHIQLHVLTPKPPLCFATRELNPLIIYDFPLFTKVERGKGGEFVRKKDEKI
jgi:hypothetical protein